jgi:hypothetical protein
MVSGSPYMRAVGEELCIRLCIKILKNGNINTFYVSLSVYVLENDVMFFISTFYDDNLAQKKLESYG